MKYLQMDYSDHFELIDSDVTTGNDTDGRADAAAPRKRKDRPSVSGAQDDQDLSGMDDDQDLFEPPAIKKTDNSDGGAVAAAPRKRENDLSFRGVQDLFETMVNEDHFSSKLSFEIYF